MRMLVSTAYRPHRPIRTVVWIDGVLTGDRFLLNLLRREAQAREGQAVGPPTGPFTLRNHLADPVSFVEIVRSVLGNSTFWITGDLVTLPTLPDGAVA